jgi:hypothetical protein
MRIRADVFHQNFATSEEALVLSTERFVTCNIDFGVAIVFAHYGTRDLPVCLIPGYDFSQAVEEHPRGGLFFVPGFDRVVGSWNIKLNAVTTSFTKHEEICKCNETLLAETSDVPVESWGI